MSDEEKKAIEVIKGLAVYYDDYSLLDEEEIEENEEVNNSINIVINLIEKLQKEIEELKEKNKFLNWYFENQKENFIHKDKIKAKIEEINKEMLNEENSLELFYRKKYCKEVLQSLLEKE